MQRASQVKELAKETVATLKEMCKSKGVAVSGTKMQLISRIVGVSVAVVASLLPRSPRRMPDVLLPLASESPDIAALRANLSQLSKAELAERVSNLGISVSGRRKAKLISVLLACDDWKALDWQAETLDGWYPRRFRSSEGPAQGLFSDDNSYTGVFLQFLELSPEQKIAFPSCKDIIDLLILGTRDYAQQQGADHTWGAQGLPTRAEILAFIGVSIRIGITERPNLRMYWSNEYDMADEVIRAAFPRDRFLLLRRYLHLPAVINSEGNSSEEDRLKKVFSFFLYCFSHLHSCAFSSTLLLTTFHAYGSHLRSLLWMNSAHPLTTLQHYQSHFV
jgi:hypothetical protein